ncbi:MAG TPA: UDP-glucose 4-epimerase GalE [Candidatus Acidoferrales bacterium]|nr:UDP-glucose 4-epimerase GalE [Candidatus Acidoferrales bacterium]
MASVLVTGGAGYVGSVCSAELLRQGHSVTVVDDLSTGFRDAVPMGARFVEMNIGDGTAMYDLAIQGRFDVVFHFAAKALIPESVTDPGIFFQRNVAAGITMLEALRAVGVRNIVFSSAAAIYGVTGSGRVDEDAPKKPLNSYGESKLIFEQVLRWYASAYGWSVFAFRYFSAAGATVEHGERHEPETHLIPLVLEAAAGERDIFNIYGDDYETPDGTCLRDFVHVLDIARAHILALEHMSPGMRCYNIGTGTSYSVRQVVGEAERITGRKIESRIAGRRPGDPGALYANPRRIMEELGWQPEHSSLEEILQSAWQWKQKRLTSATASAD